MSIKIPALEGYFGGKMGSGTYQRIINIIPPHDTFVVPFLGHCGITRKIRPCSKWLLNDIDKDVIDSWYDYYCSNASLFPEDTAFGRLDWRKMILDFLDQDNVVMYFDPPYPLSVRKSKHRYKNELTDLNHEELLVRANQFTRAKIIISTYDSNPGNPEIQNKLYQFELRHWNKIQFQAQTRNGVATETAYFNYDLPSELHDYRYLGDNYKQREQYKIKRLNLIKKFERMTTLERSYFMGVLQEDLRFNHKNITI